MEITPLIRMWSRNISNEDTLKEISEDSVIYIYDKDGIEKDKPNYCTYQKLSKTYDIWVDFGPRNLGDVVDAFMAGAARITIRNNLCPQLDIQSIKEITENPIFVTVDLEKQKTNLMNELFYQAADGFVNFNDKEKIELDLKLGNFLKQYGSKKNFYTFESNPINTNFWKHYNIEKLLVDIDKIGEFKQYGF